MGIFSTIGTAESGLTAQRLRMDTIANNIANAETTRTAEGGAYRREEVVFTPRVVGEPTVQILADGLGPPVPSFAETVQGVQVAQVAQDPSPTRLVYEPKNPDADPRGYVEYPNVNVVTEMTDMMSATRSYDANATVLNAAKSMAQTAITIARA